MCVREGISEFYARLLPGRRGGAERRGGFLPLPLWERGTFWSAATGWG